MVYKSVKNVLLDSHSKNSTPENVGGNVWLFLFWKLFNVIHILPKSMQEDVVLLDRKEAALIQIRRKLKTAAVK